MRDDTKERIDKLEAFMDEQKLKQAQQAAISEYKKERFHFWKELVLVSVKIPGKSGNSSGDGTNHNRDLRNVTHRWTTST